VIAAKGNTKKIEARLLSLNLLSDQERHGYNNDGSK
jgi:hypothetical protein